MINVFSSFKLSHLTVRQHHPTTSNSTLIFVKRTFLCLEKAEMRINRFFPFGIVSLSLPIPAYPHIICALDELAIKTKTQNWNFELFNQFHFWHSSKSFFPLSVPILPFCSTHSMPLFPFGQLKISFVFNFCASFLCVCDIYIKSNESGPFLVHF